MNQHYDHAGEENLDEFEKQLASVSLVEPGASYHRIADNLVDAESPHVEGEKQVWPWFAIPALTCALALGLYSFVQSQQEAIPIDSDIAEIDGGTATTSSTGNDALLASTTEQAFTEGTHYFELANPLDMSDSASTEVIAFFWYPCWPCNEFEEPLANWAANLPEGVTLIRIPTIWSEEMRFPAQAYYTAQVLGVLEQAHRQFYLEFERNEPSIHDAFDLQLFFAELGISAARFDEVFNSVEIQQLVESAVQSNRAYEVRATPTLFIQGQYRVNTAAGSHEDMLEVADYLIERVQNAATR